VGERLQTGLSRLSAKFIQDWKPYSDGPFLMVALASAGTDGDTWWLVDLAARKVVSGSGKCGEDRSWTVSAPAPTWGQVIRDGLNMGMAFRRHGMRYRDSGDAGAGSTTADNRVSMMSDLLGITTWSPGEADEPSPVPPPAIRYQSIGQPPGVRLGDHVGDDELPPWEKDRPPPPQEADIDAALWQEAPAEQAPDEVAAARISIRAAGRAASVTLPSEAWAKAPSAEPTDPSTSGPAQKPPPARAYARRAVGQTGLAPTSARERLNLERQLQARRQKRLRMVTAAAIALIAAVVTTSLALQHGDDPAAKVNAAKPGFGYPGPYAPVTLNADNSLTMAQPGVTQPVLDVYEDFQCSVCRTFEQGSGATAQRLADQGKVKVVYYPFTALASQPQQADSIRAWAAAKCAPASQWARYHNLLYASQPPQTSADGFTVSLLLRLGRNAGITSPSFAQCVRSQQYALEDLPLSDQIMNSGVNSMFALKLNGTALSPNLSPAQLRREIISASSRRTTTPANTPS